VYMYRLFLGLMAIALFVGCSSKEEQALMKSYTDKIKYHKHLQQTEKTEFSDENGSIVIVTATYMYTPNYDKNDLRDETFIIGVQFDDSDTKHIYFDADKLENNDDAYTVTLNGKKAKKVEKLTNSDKRLKGISFVTEWGDYYLVTYPHNRGKKFKLVLENNIYGKGMMHFAKVAKFVFTKKGF